MFKNLMLFRVVSSWRGDLQSIENALGTARFAPCAASESQSIGWIEPRGIAHGPLVESTGLHLYLVRLQVEEKILPASVIQRKVDEKAEQIERQTGRKPGRKALKEIKEDVIQALLPMAFTKRTGIDILIDPENHLLAIDTTSKARAGQVVTALVNALAGFAVSDLQTRQSPAGAMAAWLLDDEPPFGFTVDMDATLTSDDDMKSVLRYGRHTLDTEEIRQHLRDGLMPKAVALTWRRRVSFVLTDTLQLKRIQFLDVVFDGQTERTDAFDADAALATGELVPLMGELIATLGGEMPEFRGHQ